MFKVLLKNYLCFKGHANPILKNSSGQTAFQLAIEHNRYDVVEYMMNLGADILSQPFANKRYMSAQLSTKIYYEKKPTHV